MAPHCSLLPVDNGHNEGRRRHHDSHSNHSLHSVHPVMSDDPGKPRSRRTPNNARAADPDSVFHTTEQSAAGCTASFHASDIAPVHTKASQDPSSNPAPPSRSPVLFPAEDREAIGTQHVPERVEQRVENGEEILADEDAGPKDIKLKHKHKKRKEGKRKTKALPQELFPKETTRGTPVEALEEEEPLLTDEASYVPLVQIDRKQADLAPHPYSPLSEQEEAPKPTAEQAESPARPSSSITGYQPRIPKGKSIPALVALGFVAFVLVAGIAIALFRKPVSEKLTANASEWCSILKSCSDAEKFLRGTIDPSYDPCRDFYHHVCSKWRKRTRLHDGYLDELLHDLRVKIYEHLDDIKDNPVHRDPPQAMSVFYKSCYDFITQHNDLQRVVHRTVEAFEINSSSWEAARALEDLFPEIVRMSLIMGIPTVLKVSYVRGTAINVYIDIGTTLAAIYEQPLDNTLTRYLSDAVNSVSPNIDKVETNLTGMDKKFQGIYAKSESTDFSRVVASELHTVIKTDVWITAINENLPRSDITAHSFINVRGLSTTRAALSEFSALTSRQRYMYILLLVISNVLVHDYKARHNLNGASEADECLRQTSKYFSLVFHHYVIDNFQPYGAESEMAIVGGNVRRIMSDRMRTTSWVAASRRHQVANRINDIALWVGKRKVNVHQDIAYHFLTNYFVKNVALLLKAYAERQVNTTENLSEPLSQWQFAGTAGYVPEYQAIVASTALLQSDAFYDDSETRVNYATVGALLAESFFLAGVETVDNYPTGEEKKAAAIACYERRIAGMMGKKTATRNELKEMVALRIALNATYDVHRRGQEANQESDQLFFRRFCLISCGSSSGHRRFLPGYIRCNLPLLGLEEFEKAFDCPARPDLISCERSLQE